MPRPALPKPGFSLLRLHNTQSPHRIATLSPTAKTNLIDSVAQDIEGCIYAIGYYTDCGVLDAENTLQFDQVMQKIKNEERHAIRKMIRRVRVYKEKVSKAKRGYKKIRKLIRKEREEQGHRQRERLRNPVETDLKPYVENHEASEQASTSSHERCQRLGLTACSE